MEVEQVRIVEYGIYLNHKRIDTAWFDVWDEPKAIRESLVMDGYDSAIRLRRLNNYLYVTEWRP